MNRSETRLLLAATALWLLGAGCARYGFDPAAVDAARDQHPPQYSEQGVLIVDGALDGGAAAEGLRTESGVIITADLNATPPEGLCAPVGGPPETPPAPSANTIHLRPSAAMLPFCLDAPPDAADGDALCKDALGPAYRWVDGAGPSDDAKRAAAEVLGYEQDRLLNLVAKPSFNSTYWQCDVASCQLSLGGCSGVSIYSPDCLPVSGITSRLLCQKSAQAATVLASDIDPGESLPADRGFGFHGAYDPINERYGIAYMTDRDGPTPELRFLTLDDYGKAVTNDRRIDAQQGTAHPRVAVGTDAQGTLTRFFVVWQQHISDGSSRHTTRRQFTLLDGDGLAVVPPTDPFGFDTENADLQHTVSYDSTRRRFLVLGSGNDAGAPYPISVHARLYDVQGQPIGARFSMGNGKDDYSLAGTHPIHAVYDPRRDRHLVVNTDDAFFVGPDGPPATHVVLSTPALHALAVDSDQGGVVALTLDNDYAAAVLLDGDARMVRAPITWSSEPTGYTSNDYPPAYGLELFYLPTTSPGAHRGRFIAHQAQRLRVLNSDSSGCFPTIARTLDAALAWSVLIPNTKTGGFAVVYANGSNLEARIFLSNGEPY